MRSLGRRYLRSAIGVACGLLIGIAAIAILKHPGIGSLFGRSTVSQRAAVTTAAPSEASDGESVTMTLHDKPRPLPELRFTKADGRELTIADFRGRFVLLNLWATWCVPCRKEMPALDRLETKLGGPNFEVVALSIDRQGLAAVRPFFKELGLKALNIYLDPSGKAAAALNAPGIPTTLLLDREGREVARKIGPAGWDSPEMVDVLRRYLPRKGAADRDWSPSPGEKLTRFAGADGSDRLQSNSANAQHIETDEVTK